MCLLQRLESFQNFKSSYWVVVELQVIFIFTSHFSILLFFFYFVNVLLPSLQLHIFKWYPDIPGKDKVGAGRKVLLWPRGRIVRASPIPTSLKPQPLAGWWHFASLPSRTYCDGWSLEEHDISLWLSLPFQALGVCLCVIECRGRTASGHQRHWDS